MELERRSPFLDFAVERVLITSAYFFDYLLIPDTKKARKYKAFESR